MGTSIESMATNTQVIEGARLMGSLVTADMALENEPHEATGVEDRRSHDRRRVDRVLKSFEEPSMDGMLRSQIRATFLGAAAVEIAPEDDNRRGVVDRRKTPRATESAPPEESSAAPFLR